MCKKSKLAVHKTETTSVTCIHEGEGTVGHTGKGLVQLSNPCDARLYWPHRLYKASQALQGLTGRTDRTAQVQNHGPPGEEGVDALVNKVVVKKQAMFTIIAGNRLANLKSTSMRLK